ncbi:sensor histidine kinase [Euzebya sp.]|uniref:sensor histidine kinase n=1 Tax=Euzebya sp. TaxID=1971409 RepID=UPI003517FC6D
MVERSRSFGADASHQLRTPLTALRLDLEALEASGADEALLHAAFAEADRLEATIEELLALADVPMGDEHIQLGALVEARIDSWRSLAQAAGREVTVDVDPVPLVRARAAAIGQCLQVLLDNALEHGEGTITVSVASVPATTAVSRGWVRLCVSDQGPGFDEASTPGRGLRLAKSLIQAEGGRIRVERDATVCLLLPTAPVEGTPLVPPPKVPA